MHYLSLSMDRIYGITESRNYEQIRPSIIIDYHRGIGDPHLHSVFTNNSLNEFNDGYGEFNSFAKSSIKPSIVEDIVAVGLFLGSLAAVNDA